MKLSFIKDYSFPAKKNLKLSIPRHCLSAVDRDALLLLEEILVVSALISRKAISFQRFEKLTGVIVLCLRLAPHSSKGDKASGSWHAQTFPLRVPSKALAVSTFRPQCSLPVLASLRE